MKRLTEIGGRRVPFLRWSFVRMAVGMPKLLKEWQVGDGREEALGQYVLANAGRGDLDDVIRTIDFRSRIENQKPSIRARRVVT